eukprot:Gregarina_sp_Poly_1__8042@NODE_461_length_8201_cov_115_438530_g375_i0_p3_GENE_NODE_461_length_8201_cov_115_438530_g375_i0NODE_461_length_8201_cov_115_438530_g375_i0_p3_ORF_typecomplete_len388_score60_39_NODE_461_length_8201_cov_115_438530_g375_i02101373
MFESSLSPSGGSLFVDPAAGDQPEQYVDEAGNLWEWDGEDWVIWDNEGRKWIFDGDDWLCKADDGNYYLFDGEEWVIKGADGNYYTINEAGYPVLKQYGMQEVWDTGEWIHPQALPPEAPPKKPERRKKKKKKKQGPEQINIHAVLPKRTCEESARCRTGGFSPRKREVCPTKPLEIMMIKPPTPCVPHHHHVPPHPPCHHAQCTPHMCGMSWKVPPNGPQLLAPQLLLPAPELPPGQPVFVPLIDAVRQAQRFRTTGKVETALVRNPAGFITKRATDKLEWIPTGVNPYTVKIQSLEPITQPLTQSPQQLPQGGSGVAPRHCHHSCHHNAHKTAPPELNNPLGGTGDAKPLFNEDKEDSLKYKELADAMTTMGDESEYRKSSSLAY